MGSVPTCSGKLLTRFFLFTIIYISQRVRFYIFCIDRCGWGERLGNSPMLVFLVLALAEKKGLSKMDYAIIAIFFLCILFGWMPIIPQPRFLGFVWVAISFIACLPVLMLLWYLRVPEPDFDIEGGRERERTRRRQRVQFYSALELASICPIFPATYLLVTTKIIKPADSVGLFLLWTLLLKMLLFAARGSRGSPRSCRLCRDQ
jgi:hypothetical protein